MFILLFLVSLFFTLLFFVSDDPIFVCLKTITTPLKKKKKTYRCAIYVRAVTVYIDRKLNLFLIQYANNISVGSRFVLTQVIIISPER